MVSKRTHGYLKQSKADSLVELHECDLPGNIVQLILQVVHNVRRMLMFA
jgi:hypothetical protein